MAAEAAEGRGERSAAVVHWRTALAGEQRLIWRLRLAENLLALAQYGEALAEYTELDRLGADAWVGLFWCHAHLGDREAAGAVLRRWAQVRAGYARPLVWRRVLERWDEFEGTPALAALPLKDRTYVATGAVVLGGPADDGVAVPEYPTLALDLPGVARVLERFAWLAGRRSTGRIGAVVPVTPAAAPAATVLARALAVRSCGFREVGRGELALLLHVTASGTDDLVAARNQLDTRLLVFSLGGAAAAGTLDWPVAALAAPVPLVLPWAEMPTAAATAALAAAYEALPPEPAAVRAAQTAWLTAHPRGNWSGLL